MEEETLEMVLHEQDAAILIRKNGEVEINLPQSVAGQPVAFNTMLVATFSWLLANENKELTGSIIDKFIASQKEEQTNENSDPRESARNQGKS